MLPPYALLHPLWCPLVLIFNTIHPFIKTNWHAKFEVDISKRSQVRGQKPFWGRAPWCSSVLPSRPIYNPVAIYGMIFWIYLNFGVASDIQYIKDNHAQMHVHFIKSNNKHRLLFDGRNVSCASELLRFEFSFSQSNAKFLRTCTVKWFCVHYY